MRIRTISSSIANAETSDAMLKCNCAANAIAVYLSASSAYTDDVNIKKIDSSANAVTIYPNGSETIDGAASVTLTIADDKKTFVPVDGGWSVVDDITTLAAKGVAAGYKIARGTVTPTTASHTVATGLTTVVAVIVSFKGAPSLTHMFNYGDIGDQAGTPVAGSFLLKSSKPTGVADVTPIASTTPWSSVDWIAIGV